jgi:hypothetical protein
MHFAELARKHSSQIYKCSLGCCQSAADDLQNVPLQTFRNINSLEGKSQISTWLAGVAAIDAMRVYAVGPDSPGDLYPGCQH